MLKFNRCELKEYVFKDSDELHSQIIAWKAEIPGSTSFMDKARHEELDQLLILVGLVGLVDLICLCIVF